MFCQELLQSRQLFLFQKLPVRYLAGISFPLASSEPPTLFLKHKNRRKGFVRAYDVMY